MAADAQQFVEAAGGLVWNDRDELLVVHRPRYDDWSLPKGKREEGESLEACALREVHEETGFRCRRGAALPAMHYFDHRGRPKTVHYWHMAIESGAFTQNDEVDEIRWVAVASAAELLSYTQDVELVLSAAKDRTSG